MKLWRKPYNIDDIKIPHGEIHILQERCKGCKFCIEYCPCDVLELSDEFNAVGYHPPRVKNPDDCLNCGLCQLLCPEFAIWTTLKEENSDRNLGIVGTPHLSLASGTQRAVSK